MKLKLIALFLMAFVVMSSVVSAAGIDYAIKPNTPHFTVIATEINGQPVVSSDNSVKPKITEQTPFDVVVRVQNVGISGTMKVESGIYESSLLDSWGITFGVVNTIPNCVYTQQNLQTKEVTLTAGEVKDITFTIVDVPQIQWYDRYSVVGNNYKVFTQAFQDCWSSNGGSQGITSRDSQVVYLTDDMILDSSASCSDHVMNQDETDIDCGGSKCKKCELGQRALLPRDSITGYVTNGLVAVPPDTNNDGTPDYSKYTGKSSVGEVVGSIENTIKDNIGVIIVGAAALLYFRKGRII